jgi:5-methyltetrahydropteroyltriglutamate--homocysteine methyltransferase
MLSPEFYVEAFNREVRGLRAKTELWCHTCWGSPAAQRTRDRAFSYATAIPYLDQLDVDVLMFEAKETDGADLELIGRGVGKDKKVAIGVISHRTLQIERPEEVAGLIRKALQHIEPERLILSSDCGFGRQGMSRIHAFYKMVSMTLGANIVRKELGLDPVEVRAADPRFRLIPPG